MAPAHTQFAVAVHMMAVLGYRQRCRAGGGEPPVTSAYLAASVNATPSFVRRVLAVLVKAGLVKTVRGANGYCSLPRPAEEISLLDIYRAVEAPKVFALHSYPPEERCSISCRMHQVMEGVLADAQSSLEESLSSQTLAELVARLAPEAPDQPLP